MIVKDKITPKLVKGIRKASNEDKDYALLYFGTENDYKTFEEAKEVYEEMDIVEFSDSVANVMQILLPKLESFNTLGPKLDVQ